MKLICTLMIAASLVACGKKADTAAQASAPAPNPAQHLVDDKKAAEDAVKAMEAKQQENASAAAAAETK